MEIGMQESLAMDSKASSDLCRWITLIAQQNITDLFSNLITYIIFLFVANPLNIFRIYSIKIKMSLSVCL